MTDKTKVATLIDSIMKELSTQEESRELVTQYIAEIAKETNISKSVVRKAVKALFKESMDKEQSSLEDASTIWAIYTEN